MRGPGGGGGGGISPRSQPRAAAFQRWFRVAKPYADRPAQLIEFASQAEECTTTTTDHSAAAAAATLAAVTLSKVLKVVLGGATHAFQLQRERMRRERARHAAYLVMAGSSDAVGSSPHEVGREVGGLLACLLF